MLIILALVLTLSGQRVSALDPAKSVTQYAHRIWGQEEGLFQPTIYSIQQTRDGFLWLGTQDSLIKFDGVHFREFDPSPNAPFHRSLVRDMAEDRAGNLWAASVGGGLLRIAPDGTAVHYTTAEGLPSNDVFCVDTSDPNAVWACTSRGLARYNGQSFIAVALSTPVHNTCLAASGTRWVSGLDLGLARLDGSHLQPYAGRRLSKGANITALLCEHDGDLWAGTENGLLHLHNGSLQQLTTRDGIPDNAVFSLRQGANGEIWIGTNNGITRWRNGQLSVYRTSDGLSHSQVLALFTDREGTLWAGTKDGLDQFTDGNVTPYTHEEGLSSNNVGPVLQDKDGRLWIGTLGQGLDVYDGTRFRVLSTANGLIDNTILSLESDGAGALWAGTKHGLNRLEHGRITDTFTRRNGLSGEEIRSLFLAQDGTLWVGTEGGLDRWNGTRFVNSNHLLTAEKIGGIIALGGGRIASLIASTELRGVYAVRNGVATRSSADITRPVDCFFIDRVHGETWMGTLGSGLLRYRNGVFTHVRLRDGLYDNRIYSIVSDADANLWMASSKGIFRVSHRDLDDFVEGRASSVTSFPFSTGQLRFECQSGVQPAATRTTDGRLWFATTSGLVMIDPARLITNSVPPPVRLTTVFVNGQLFPLAGATELPLTPSQRNLELRYAGLSFISPEHVTFRYRLEGYEKNWIDAGTRRVAFYTNLPPGHFEFEVSARNADGLWSTRSAALRFSVAPRLYQRMWFFPAVVSLAALLIVLVWRLRVARLRRRFGAVIDERSRIARELHDTLLQGVAGVTMQLQALWTTMPSSRERQKLLDIIADAEHCAKEARQSLWGLRTPRVGAAEFSDKLAELARQTCAGQPFALRLRIQPISLERVPEAEYQLLRIVKEALANAIQHAAPSSVEIRLTMVGGIMHLVIADNGIGFVPASAQRAGHFGLLGMQERAAEIKAELQIDSQEGQGTAVRIALPLTELQPASKSNARVPLSHHIE